jgi:nucleotide-binding universal stress UspA family protein
MVMNKVLVPLENQGELAHNAALFAVGFAQRTGAEVLFLSIHDDPQPSSGRTAPADPAPPRTSPDLEALVQQSLQKGLKVGTYFTHGEYVRRVSEFAREQGISRIVVAMPEAGSGDFERISQQVAALRRSLNCPLVVVRTRQEAQRQGAYNAAGQRYPWRPRPAGA